MKKYTYTVGLIVGDKKMYFKYENEMGVFNLIGSMIAGTKVLDLVVFKEEVNE